MHHNPRSRQQFLALEIGQSCKVKVEQEKLEQRQVD